MSSRYIKSGFDSARSHLGLSFIIFGGNLAMALVLSLPVLATLSAATEMSGFGDDMAQGFDLALWADMLEASPGLVGTLLSQMLWILPILFVWKMASSAGLVHAQSSGGGKSFWTGLGKYTWRATVLGLLYMIPTIAVLFFVSVLTSLLSLVLTSEVGTFWVQFVFTPLALFLGVAIVDMMHDFGRLELILGKKSIMDSWFAGFRWPLNSGTVNSIYIGWMVLGILFLVLPFMLDFSMGGILLAFLVQQILLYGRAFITVGWLGSEVLFFEEVAPAPVQDAIIA